MLNLTLGRRVALLHLGAAALNRRSRMNLRGAGRTADAVASGSAAEQYNHIARVGTHAHHVLSRCRRNHRAELHALCDIIRVIDFFYIAGRKTDLVSVGRIAVRRLRDKLTLRELARQGFCERAGRIRRAGNAHCLIDIGSAGEWVANRAAEAGRRTAEGLNLRRVVVGLVLKVDEPLLLLAVHRNRHDNGAGIDLIRLLLVRELAVPL